MIEKIKAMHYTMEELREVYQRVYLNGILSYQRDNPKEPLSREMCQKFADDADRACLALDQKGMVN